MVSRLEGDLETERDRVRQQREREEELRVKVLSLEGQITHKQQEVERLERMLEVVKQEASAQMHDRVCVCVCGMSVLWYVCVVYLLSLIHI